MKFNETYFYLLITEGIINNTYFLRGEFCTVYHLSELTKLALTSNLSFKFILPFLGTIVAATLTLTKLSLLCKASQYFVWNLLYANLLSHRSAQPSPRTFFLFYLFFATRRLQVQMLLVAKKCCFVNKKLKACCVVLSMRPLQAK